MSEVLTAEDVAKRWKADIRCVWDAVDNTENALPFFFLGQSIPKRGTGGKRGSYRFRLEEVERWEQRASRSFQRSEADQAKAEAVALGLPSDVPIVSLRKGRRKHPVKM